MSTNSLRSRWLACFVSERENLLERQRGPETPSGQRQALESGPVATHEPPL